MHLVPRPHPPVGSGNVTRLETTDTKFAERPSAYLESFSCVHRLDSWSSTSAQRISTRPAMSPSYVCARVQSAKFLLMAITTLVCSAARASAQDSDHTSKLPSLANDALILVFLMSKK